MAAARSSHACRAGSRVGMRGKLGNGVEPVTETLMFVVTIVQFVMMLLNNAPNARLLAFGRGLGRYLQQIANFLTFASEEIPFPFSDWPSRD